MNCGRQFLSLVLLAPLTLLYAADISMLRAESTATEVVPTPKPKKGAKKAAKALQKVKDVSADQEKQAIGFATAQHSELVELLDRLEEMNPEQYGRAIRELYKTSERLRLMADRNPERHSLELSLWKLESRIRLTLAQIAMEDDAEIEKQLAPLMAERRDLKRRVLELERRQATSRIAEIDQQLETLQKAPEAETAKELKRLKQTVVSQMKPGKVKAKQAKRAKAAESAPVEEKATEPSTSP